DVCSSDLLDVVGAGDVGVVFRLVLLGGPLVCLLAVEVLADRGLAGDVHRDRGALPDLLLVEGYQVVDLGAGEGRVLTGHQRVGVARRHAAGAHLEVDRGAAGGGDVGGVARPPAGLAVAA